MTGIHVFGLKVCYIYCTTFHNYLFLAKYGYNRQEEDIPGKITYH